MTDDAARDAALREEGRMQGLREAVKWCEAEQSVWAAQVGAYAKGSRNALVAKVRENAMKGAAAELRLLASTPDASQGSAPVAERQFPVLAGGDHKEYARVRAPGSVPWSLLAPHEEWAQRNHGQSLEKLARRGGLSMCEMVAIIEHRRWRGMTADEQMTSLRRHLAEHAASSAPPAAPQGSAAGQEAIEFSVVIAGQSHPMKLPGHAMVGHLMATAVADTGNTGQPYYEWELRTLDGALIGWDQTLAQAGIRSGATLFMNPRAGVGGSQPAAPQGSPLPAEVLAVIRDPRVPLEGEEGAANIVLARGCKSCLRADRPYWHQAGTPCPLASTTASAQGGPLPGAQCICPFPRMACPACDHQGRCEACRLAYDEYRKGVDRGPVLEPRNPPEGGER